VPLVQLAKLAQIEVDAHQALETSTQERVLFTVVASDGRVADGEVLLGGHDAAVQELLLTFFLNLLLDQRYYILDSFAARFHHLLLDDEVKGNFAKAIACLARLLSFG